MFTKFYLFVTIPLIKKKIVKKQFNRFLSSFHAKIKIFYLTLTMAFICILALNIAR